MFLCSILIAHSIYSAAITLYVTVDFTTSNTIILSLTSFGPVVDYMIAWKRDTSGKCSAVHRNTFITPAFPFGSTVPIIGCEEDSSYTITVTATSITGNTVIVPVTAMTMKAGDVLESMN